ncbi:MAG TPA: glycosyltransferase [Candidatus Binataceae bacterium]|nr:glycosyltransferase [Candidatus Binataceae bacterium]
MISIVIPSSGRPGLIERAIEAIAVRIRDLESVEVVVVDDTPDGSISQRVSCERRDVKLRVVRGPGRGPGGARNIGAKAARGDLLVFIDDDCVPVASWLEAYRRKYLEEPDALLFGPISDGLPDNLWSHAYHTILDYLCITHLSESIEESSMITSRSPFAPGANFAIGRIPFLSALGFDSSLRRVSEDRAFSAKWLQMGRRIRGVPAAGVTHYHPLTFRQFLRQQFLYGRGACQFRQSLERDAIARSLELPGFYFGLLVHALNAERGRKRILVAVALAQLAVASGYVYEVSMAGRRLSRWTIQPTTRRLQSRGGP